MHECPDVRLLRPASVGVALLLLAAGQALAVARGGPLPGDAELTALPNGYSYATREGRLAVAGFQLRNTGGVELRVRELTATLPGLELLDVVVSGEPTLYRAAGEGPGPVPELDVAPGDVIEVLLTYRLSACPKVPQDRYPLVVRASVGRSRGVLRVALPTAPSEEPDAGPDDEVEWQRVLIRDLCG